ncbi:hypothetical protein [Streptomyces sp. NPDC057580]|uniref:hypothetical protein n=1 Tax=Streptomyces sp. NPDC057580 TaxID=3346173 RepID=UPI0036956B7A
MSVPPAVPVPPACSDAVDLAATGERMMVDLAGRGLEPLVVLGRYRYLRAQEPLPVQRHCSLVVLALPGRGSFASRSMAGCGKSVRGKCCVCRRAACI